MIVNGQDRGADDATPRSTSTSLPSEPSLHASPNSDFYVTAWRSGACSIFPMLILQIAGYCLVSPYLPDLLTDFYASRHAGHGVHCEDFVPPHALPAACLSGSVTNVRWKSVTDALSSFLLFFIAPMLGVWSDIAGRKPFLILSVLLSSLGQLIIFLHIFCGLSLFNYYPVEVLNGAIAPQVVMLAYVADVLPQHHRAAGFSLLLGAFSVGVAIFPILGVTLGIHRAVALACALKFGAIVYTMVFVKESLSPEARESAREAEEQRVLQLKEQRHGRTHSADASAPLQAASTTCSWCMTIPAIRYTVQGIAIITRNSEFVKLASALMVGSFIVNGMMEIENQYLLSLFGFQQTDFAVMALYFGAGMALVQIVCMPLLLRVLPERIMIILAYAATSLKIYGLGVAVTKWQCIAVITSSALSLMAYPAIAAIKANAVPTHEQGAVQGALSAVQALASALGPLLFMNLYTWTTEAVHKPRAIMSFGLLLSLIPLVLISFLNTSKLERWQETCEEPHDAAEPLLPRRSTEQAHSGYNILNILDGAPRSPGEPSPRHAISCHETSNGE